MMCKQNLKMNLIIALAVVVCLMIIIIPIVTSVSRRHPHPRPHPHPRQGVIALLSDCGFEQSDDAAEARPLLRSLYLL